MTAHATFAVFMTALVTATGVAYAAGVVRLGRRGRPWRWARTISFFLGLGLLLLGLWLPNIVHTHHDLRLHMVQHLLLGMFAPLPLVLGMPGLLLLRNLPRRGVGVVMGLLVSRPLRCLTHPVTAAVSDMGAMYLLYLTPLYLLSLHNGYVHAWVHLHFIVAGYLFTWAIAGPDPAPRRPSYALRLTVLFLAAGAHAVLGKLMYAYAWPRATGDALEDVRAAAQWMYYGGDLAELLLAILLFAQWRGRHALGRGSWAFSMGSRRSVANLR